LILETGICLPLVFHVAVPVTIAQIKLPDLVRVRIYARGGMDPIRESVLEIGPRSGAVLPGGGILWTMNYVPNHRLHLQFDCPR
jgi:hypothetical protein